MDEPASSNDEWLLCSRTTDDGNDALVNGFILLLSTTPRLFLLRRVFMLVGVATDDATTDA